MSLRLSQRVRADLLAIAAVLVLFAILSLPGDWVLAVENWVKSLINLPRRPPSPGWLPADKVIHVILFLATALPVTLAVRAHVKRRNNNELRDSLGFSGEEPHAQDEKGPRVEKRRLRVDQVGTTAFILMLILGILSEWIQSFVPGRSADPLDLAADLVGSMLGIALASLFFTRKKKPGGSGRA